MNTFIKEGIDLLKQFEGCRLTAYKDLGGIWTIGVGHTGKSEAYAGNVISQAQADDLLDKDLAVFKAGVSALVKAPVSDCAYSALVCFSFNVGLHNLATSTLLRKLNLNDPTTSNEFLRWDKVNGVEVPGLLRRRKAEQDLFLS